MTHGAPIHATWFTEDARRVARPASASGGE